MRPGLFITGTDTGVGKTRVAWAIARATIGRGRRVGVLKPVATGVVPGGGVPRCEDAEALIDALGAPVPVGRVCPIAFEAPLAPPVAARLAGEPLDFRRVLREAGEALAWWDGQGAEVMIVEGVGGLLCPLAEGATVADLAVALDYPLVIVARPGLGTLNHTLLTVEAARVRGLRIAGVVLNAARPEPDLLARRTNLDELSRRLDGVAVLADLDHHIGEMTLPLAIDRVNWSEWARPPRLDGTIGRH